MIKRLIIYSFVLNNLLLAYTVSDATGQNGLVVSSKEQASQVGIDILKSGGNAIDAAVGVAFALSVTHPSAGNLGGGGFMVLRLADGTVTSIDFREKAPANSTQNMFLDSDGNVINGSSWSSALASGVPGTVAGLGYAHNKYGTMNWFDLVYPSVQLARFGFPLDYFNTSILNSEKYSNFLKNDFFSKKYFTKNKEYKLNDLFIQKDLSETLLRIAKYGYNEFYFGKTSKLIIDTMVRTGGIITAKDLAAYKPIERDPIFFEYHDYRIFSMPPPSSGGITLANILNQLENINLDSLGYKSSDYVHYFSEAEKRAYADRAMFLGDTDFIDVPIEKLISDDYAYKKFLTIDPEKALDSYELNNELFISKEESEETTHFSIVDSFGNAVSLTYTINGWFGSGISVNNAGFLLNNEMDDFSIKPGYPNAYGLIGSESNSIQPNKRMLSSMTPTIVEKPDSTLYMVLGSPGGSTIITTIAQIIVNVVNFDMDIDQAVESKRFHHQWIPPYIQIEQNSMSDNTISALMDKGHNIVLRSKIGIGEANCILSERGYFFGAADSRRGAVAKGY
mgnify:CR=1 FL=1